MKGMFGVDVTMIPWNAAVLVVILVLLFHVKGTDATFKSLRNSVEPNPKYSSTRRSIKT